MNQKVSFIIPTYNESTHIRDILDKFIAWCSKYNYEIVIVDDSNDETVEVISQYTREKKLNTVKLIKGARKGKGNAIKIGLSEATGEIIFYLDADLVIPLENIDVFISEINNNNVDVVIGKRLLRFKHRNIFRLILSVGLFLIQRLFIFNSSFFYDTQCGFKAFTNMAAKKIAPKQTVNGGMFDVEILYIARLLDLKISQIQIIPGPELRETKIRLLSCLIKDPIDLLKIKINSLLGKYKV